MTLISINVSQLSALAADLNQRGRHVGTGVATATRKAGMDVERDGKILCPVDTGNLRNSISTTVTGSGNSAEIGVEIGPTANYGDFVETGTSRMRPQPYMGPATDRNVPGWIAAIEQIATGGI